MAVRLLYTVTLTRFRAGSEGGTSTPVKVALLFQSGVLRGFKGFKAVIGWLLIPLTPRYQWREGIISSIIPRYD